MGEWTLSVNDKDLDADIHPPRHVFTAAAVGWGVKDIDAIDALSGQPLPATSGAFAATRLWAHMPSPPHAAAKECAPTAWSGAPAKTARSAAGTRDAAGAGVRCCTAAAAQPA